MKNRNIIFGAILSVVACFGLLSRAQAAPQVAPPPDGCYPGFTTAEGCKALQNLTTGAGNTGLGWFALFSTTDGQFNTGVGAGALALNTADSNTAVGTTALLLNTSGISNTAVGQGALVHNDTGSENTAVGVAALTAVTTGSFNTAIGGIAGFGLTSGSFNIMIGDIAGGLITTQSNTITIGSGGGTASNATWIGHIRGATTVNNDAIGVVIDSAGQLGTLSSSARFKKDIKPMDKASDVILALKPVTFHYKSDNKNRPEFGLIAEEVAKINPNLVVRDQDGEIYTVRYEAVNAMLLNEFLKEHKRVGEQQATIAELKSTVAEQKNGMETLAAQLKQQAAEIQKVSARIEVVNPGPRTVANK